MKGERKRKKERRATWRAGVKGRRACTWSRKSYLEIDSNDRSPWIAMSARHKRSDANPICTKILSKRAALSSCRLILHYNYAFDSNSNNNSNFYIKSLQLRQ